MPNHIERELFNQLESTFGHLRRWEAFTIAQDFDAMSEHEAAHFLGYLLAEFWKVRIPYLCRCGKLLRVYEPAKNPAENQPGVSPDPVP